MTNERNNGKQKRTVIALLAIATLSSMLVFSTAGTNFLLKPAYAVEDANGFEKMNPYSTYSLSYSNEFFESSQETTHYQEDFRQDGSMRVHWFGIDMRSVMAAATFKLSPGSCTTNPNEQIALEFGGWHTSTAPSPAGDTVKTPAPNANFADAYLIEFAFDENPSRVRFEKTHGGTIVTDTTGQNSQKESTFNAADLCSSPDGYVSVMWFKVNLDDNCDGVIDTASNDKIGIAMYVDLTGLNTDGSPKNNWERAYKKEYQVEDVPLKDPFEPWVRDGTLNQYQDLVMRVDLQDPSDWTAYQQGGSDDNVKYQTFKRVSATKSGC